MTLATVVQQCFLNIIKPQPAWRDMLSAGGSLTQLQTVVSLFSRCATGTGGQLAIQ